MKKFVIFLSLWNVFIGGFIAYSGIGTFRSENPGWQDMLFSGFAILFGLAFIAFWIYVLWNADYGGNRGG